nr:MAG: hypothetical protein [Bacteroides phage NR01]
MESRVIRGRKAIAPYLFIGVFMIHPRLITEIANGWML